MKILLILAASCLLAQTKEEAQISNYKAQEAKLVSSLKESNDKIQLLKTQLAQVQQDANLWHLKLLVQLVRNTEQQKAQIEGQEQVLYTDLCKAANIELSSCNINLEVSHDKAITKKELK